MQIVSPKICAEVLLETEKERRSRGREEVAAVRQVHGVRDKGGGGPPGETINRRPVPPCHHPATPFEEVVCCASSRPYARVLPPARASNPHSLTLYT